MALLLITVGLGLLSITTTALITKRLFTPCSWYWLGWMAGVIGADLSHVVNILPAVSPFGEELIARTHVGAFIGFLLASIWIRSIPSRRRPPLRGVSLNQISRLPHWIWLLVVGEAILGVALLARRVLDVGVYDITGILTIRQSFLQEAYLQDTLPPLLRVYSYLNLAALVAPVVCARIDARNGTINFRTLLLVFVATIPGGLSTGGRVWVASVFSFYVVAYFIAIDGKVHWSRAVRALRALLVPTAALLMLFAAIGLTRDAVAVADWFKGSSNENPVVTMLSPVYIYAGIPVSAVGPYSEYATQEDMGWGQFTFPWYASQLGRLGIWAEESKYVDFIRASRRYVVLSFDPILGSTHASIIPMLIADFGESNLPIWTAVLAGLLQAMFLLFARKGLWGHTLGTVICLYGGLFAFQDALIGSSNASVPVIAAVAVPPVMNAASKLWRTFRNGTIRSLVSGT